MPIPQVSILFASHIHYFYPKLFTQFNFYPVRSACPVECEAYSSGVAPGDDTGVKIRRTILPESKDHLTGALSTNG